MKVSYSKSEIASNETVRSAIVGLINDAQHGGFMSVSGLRPKTGHGEVANYLFCKGINYGNAVAVSLAKLAEIESDSAFQITVTRGVWKNAAGAFSPTGRKSKEYDTSGTVTKTYGMKDAALLAALAKVRQGLVAPAPVTKEYAKLGNGVYEADGVIYLRDLRLVSKTVVIHGDYPFSASGEETAIADALRRDMPVGKYREFRLDGDYDAITLGGMELSAEASAPADVPQVKTAGIGIPAGVPPLVHA